MARHVYLSKRAALGIHLAKMNPARRQKYNENRRERQSKSRQAIFINEYFHVKYNELYKEAALFYNQVNAHYPHKHDLRKCEAFKNWKAAQQTNTNSCEKTVTKKTERRYHKVSYPDISVEQSKSPEKPESPIGSPNNAASTESPNSTERFGIPVYSVAPQKTMRLEIPLMKSSVVTQQKSPLQIPQETMVTETLQIVTQQESPLQISSDDISQKTMAINPSLTEEIPEDIIKNIITELRADPEMRTIMTNIEEEFEFDDIGMEVEIAVDDRLEDELENLVW